MKPLHFLLVLILGSFLSGSFIIAEPVDRIKTLDCKSKKHERKECSVKGTIKSVQLLEQKSDSPCTEGGSFGFSGDRVWVDKGCSGEFEVSYASSESSIWDLLKGKTARQKKRLSCKSKGFKPDTCRVEGAIYSLKLRKQKSDSPCRLGESYGYRGESVWVSNGCEAEFEVEYEPGNSDSKPISWGSRDKKKKVTCESKRNKHRTCSVGGPIESLQLRKQKSGSPCVEGDTYGFTGDTIWVDRGCRAEFEVKYHPY
jgi:hypothetical protein